MTYTTKTMFKEIKDIPQKELLPGFRGRFAHGENLTLAFWEIDKGSVLPEHSHFHEQTSQVIEGEFEMTVDGNTKILQPGMVVVIPPNAVHSGRALTDCKITDVFSPVREDYKF